MADVLQVSVNGVELVPVLSTARKRWRVAYTTVYSTRALRSLTARGISAHTHNRLLQPLLRSPSFTSVDVEPEAFPISQSALSEIVHRKSFQLVHQFDGVEGVTSALKSDTEKGIQGSIDDLTRRRHAYGSNVIHRPPPKLLRIGLKALKDPIIIMLILCAVLSLGFGIKKQGPQGWSDGGSIFVAVFLVMTITALTNIWPRRQFHKISKTHDNINIEVIRDGQKQQVSISDAVVGDVICLKAGNQVPADGLYLCGDSLKVDESHITKRMAPVEVDVDQNPFLLCGTMVISGSARMVVTAVGMNTEWGKMESMKCRDSAERTPLQEKLHNMTLLIALAGLVVAFLVLLVLLTRYFTGEMRDENGNRSFIPGQTSFSHVYDAVIGIVVTPIAIAAAAIPEGLLLAATITIGYSIMMMAAEDAFVRNLSACEAIGAVTVICTNKKGSMTMNCLKVSQFCIGTKAVGEELHSSRIEPKVVQILQEGIGLSTREVALETVSDLSHPQSEKAIYDWCVEEMGMDVNQLRECYTVLEAETSHLEWEDCSIVIHKKVDDTVHLHKRGAPMKILGECSHHYGEDGVIRRINTGTRAKLEQIIQKMELSCFQCVAFAHKRISGAIGNEDDSGKPKEEPLKFLGIVGVNAPCRPEVKEAVKECQDAGVDIKMITKDDLNFARATALECGILKPNQEIVTGEVVEAEEFRNYDDNERLEKTDKIRVIARATTFDKLLVVQSLQQRGHVVAFTGDSMEDAPALREADVGVSLGIHGADIAKDSSDIIVLDENFASVSRVLRWGRGTYNNIQIFGKFQLTASIASLVIDFVTAISAREPPMINIVTAISVGKVPYATLQVLWVKLIIGTLAAVALTIEKPSEELMQQPPVNRKEPLITNIMWRDIIFQALYQIIILLTIQFKGESTFKLNAKEKDTIIFNIFVLCQIFIIFDTSKFEKNVFKGLRRRKLFLGITGTIALLQVVIVEFLKRFANTERLNWQQWAACIVVGILSWPTGWLVRSIPVSHQNLNYRHI